jgi:hypothetical protein
MNIFPPDAVHETPESRLREVPPGTPEYGFGSWSTVQERYRRFRFINDQWPVPAGMGRTHPKPPLPSKLSKPPQTTL